MDKIKMIWKTACFNFRLTYRSPRFIFTFLLAFMLCLMLSDKAVSFAQSYGTSMQMFEVFILAFGDANSIMLSALLLIFLFADIPVVTQVTPYYISRISKDIWVWGQIVYVFLVTILYVIFLMAVTCGISAHISFPGNMWSETMAMIGYSGAGSKIALPVSVKILEMSSPYRCAGVIGGLVALYSLLNATLILIFRLGKYPVLGSVSVFLLNGYGLFLNPSIFTKIWKLPGTLAYKASVITGWISPLNHATYYMHNFGYDYLPEIWMSVVLFAALILVNMMIIRRKMKKYEFVFIQRND